MASAGGGLVYDTDRKRAIALGVAFSSSHGWVEFDGYQFYPFELPYGLYYFRGGSAGYDPISRRAVYRGLYDIETNDIKTFEYDGAAWTAVTPVHDLPGFANSPGIQWPFVPELEGLLAKPVSYDGIFPETWVNKDHDWQQISTDAEVYTDEGAAHLLYDSMRNVVILLGVEFEAGLIKYFSWEMRKTRHCRPVGKP